MSVRAVLFDVDGTLYRQAPVRAAMAAELAFACVSHRPGRGGQPWRLLRTFRIVREQLRARGHASESLESAQYAASAEAAGCDPDQMRAVVREWMFERPLRHVARARRPGTVTMLTTLHARGILAGVFSDYPTREKIAALGVQPWIGVHACATDRDINAFKPHPRGFVRVCEQWGLPASEVLYVGDRLDTDAAGAAAAGMRCAVIGARRGTTLAIRSLGDVIAIVDAARGPVPATMTA